MIGHDPARPATGVTLDNWQTSPQLAWSFQHIADLFPTATIARGSGPVADLVSAPSNVADLPCLDYGYAPTTVGKVMAGTDTDGWMVARDGVVLAEDYPRGMGVDTPHLLMSVSKSLVGTVTGALVDRGVLDPEDAVTTHLPDLEDSGYAGATVRHLLDMRSGIAFSEDYLDPNAEVRVLEQAIGWAPRRLPAVPGTMYDFLATLRQKSPHGGPFDYRSGETDVLGWVCESASGVRMPDLMSDLVWSRLGAEFDANIGVDSAGTGMFDGGISASLRDLFRFGAMLLGGGVSLTGERIISEAWVNDTLTGGSDSRQAFADSSGDNRMPGGMYRNQLWFPYPGNDVVLALGIHGQMVYVHRPARVVAAKLSSWAAPQDAWRLFSTLRAFDAIAAAPAGELGS